jgi:hypothetical protein
LRYSNGLCKGIASDTTCLKEDVIYLGKDTVVPNEGIGGCNEGEPREEDEGVSNGNNGDPVQPGEDPVGPEGDILRKDVSIFHAGSDEYVPRTCLLDSCSPVSLISTGALKGIRCDFTSGDFGVISGLGSVIFPIKGTVRLRFKFWDRDEIFEEEFRVLPQINILGHTFGPGFDCLLCWDWMRTHPRVWKSMLKDVE